MPRNPEAKKFTKILKAACKKARKTCQYDSEKTRADLTAAFELACPGKTPFSWQLHITEALILGLDCMLVAGTGAEKMMPMAYGAPPPGEQERIHYNTVASNRAATRSGMCIMFYMR